MYVCMYVYIYIYIQINNYKACQLRGPGWRGLQALAGVILLPESVWENNHYDYTCILDNVISIMIVMFIIHTLRIS